MVLKLNQKIIGEDGILFKGASGNLVEVDTSGNINVSGSVIFPAAQSVNATITGTPNVNISSQTGNVDVDIKNALLNISGAVYFEDTQSVQFDAAQDVNVTFPTTQQVAFEGDIQKVEFSGAQTVQFASAQDVAITSGNVGITGSPVVNVAGQEVYAIQSGAYVISGEVTFPSAQTVQFASAQDVNATIGGTPNVNIASTSGNIDVDIQNALIEVNATQSGAWTTNIAGTADINITNSSVDMNISGATIQNGTLLSDWKYVVDNGTLIGGHQVANNSTLILYTVPAGKIAYITQANISYACIALANTERHHVFTSGANIINVITISSGHQLATASGEHAVVLGTPIKLTANEAVKVISNKTNVQVAGTIVGYEVDA